MANGTAVYGVNPDGSVSRCRAKDPAHCRYHKNSDGTAAKHMRLTEAQANAVNEAAARANAMPESNSLQRSMKADARGAVKNITHDLDSMDGDKAYERAVKAMRAMDGFEDETREPVKMVDDLLPRPKKISIGGSEGDRILASHAVYEDEISSLRDASRDLTGHKLIGGEERMIADRLKEYAARNIIRSSTSYGASSIPSPAEERALMTLTANPAASSEVMDDLAGNERVMKFGAKFIESSPYADAAAKEKAFKTNPANALESPMIEPKYVNSALDAATADPSNHMDVLENALRNPQASPEKAYESYKSLSGSKDVNTFQLRYLEWQMALNPNPEFRRRVSELDEKGDLQITKDWRKAHADSESA